MTTFFQSGSLDLLLPSRPDESIGQVLFDYLPATVKEI